MRPPQVRRIWVLMILVAVAGAVCLLVAVKGPDWLRRYRRWKVDRPVHAQLDRVIPMRFPRGIPLQGLFVYVKQSTTSPATPSGLPLFVDPVGLQEAGQTMMSRVTIDRQGVPLRDALRESLGQLGLTYTVKNGLITVTSEEAVDEEF